MCFDISYWVIICHVPPILIYKKKNRKNGVTKREFYTTIPMERWQENTDSICDVMDIHCDCSKRENHQVSYETYHDFANKFLQKDKVTHDIFVYDEETMSAIRSLCKENLVSVNDYLTAKMFEEDKTDKIIIASDLRKQLHCYSQGALGNYSTAFSVRFKGKNADTVAIAGKVHKQVQKIMKTPASLYLILQCYARLTPSLIDAAAISTLGNFDSKAGRFIGTVFFGFQNPMSYSITNLGKIESRSIDNAVFIPPASPAVKKIKGVLTVNGRMNICVCQR